MFHLPNPSIRALLVDAGEYRIASIGSNVRPRVAHLRAKRSYGPLWNNEMIHPQTREFKALKFSGDVKLRNLQGSEKIADIDNRLSRARRGMPGSARLNP